MHVSPLMTKRKNSKDRSRCLQRHHVWPEFQEKRTAGPHRCYSEQKDIKTLDGTDFSLEREVSLSYVQE